MLVRHGGLKGREELVGHFLKSRDPPISRSDKDDCSLYSLAKRSRVPSNAVHLLEGPHRRSWKRPQA